MVARNDLVGGHCWFAPGFQLTRGMLPHMARSTIESITSRKLNRKTLKGYLLLVSTSTPSTSKYVRHMLTTTWHSCRHSPPDDGSLDRSVKLYRPPKSSKSNMLCFQSSDSPSTVTCVFLRNCCLSSTWCVLSPSLKIHFLSGRFSTAILVPSDLKKAERALNKNEAHAIHRKERSRRIKRGGEAGKESGRLAGRGIVPSKGRAAYR